MKNKFEFFIYIYFFIVLYNIQINGWNPVNPLKETEPCQEEQLQT